MEVLAGVLGIVVGALLGGSGKYFSLRRDAWTQARASGLLLLADVRALLDAEPSDPVVATTAVGIKSWETHSGALAGFRPGNFPSGFRAEEWLTLARCFAHLRNAHPEAEAGAWSSEIRSELVEAERLLARFERDPPVFGYVLRTGLAKYVAAVRRLFGMGAEDRT